MVELFWAHHLVRSLLEESVLGDGVRVIEGRGLEKACSSAWDNRFIRCDRSVFSARLLQACKLRKRSPVFKLSVMRPFCESVGVLLKVSTW